MHNMYAVIFVNPGDNLPRVMSRHPTLGAAAEAASKLRGRCAAYARYVEVCEVDTLPPALRNRS